MLLDFFRSYPYFLWSLVLMAACLAALPFCQANLRRTMVMSGLLMLPFAFTSLLIEPGYWLPHRLCCFLTGPEDFIIAFATGGLSWIMASWPLRRRLRVEVLGWRILGRYVVGTLAGLSVGGVFRLFGVGPLAAMVLAFSIFGVAIFWLGGRLWQVALSGFVGFTALYFAVVKVVFLLCPEFIHQWNEPNLWGPRIWGVPIDEITGAAGFAAAWPLFMAYLFCVRIGRDGEGDPTPQSRVRICADGA